MRALVYDISMLAGFGLVVAGVAMEFGLAPALIAAGASVIAMTRLAVSGS